MMTWTLFFFPPAFLVLIQFGLLLALAIIVFQVFVLHILPIWQQQPSDAPAAGVVQPA
jgi:hypothetical protein